MQKEKLKVRFTSLDITVLVRELKEKLIGMRIQNIYDLNNKMYMFKMGQSENKQQLVIENGVRFHTTQQEIQTKKTPSAFTMKFRKYLRSKRLEDIRQIGVERVVVMTFGQGEIQNHLIIELYSQGNILLTDKDYKIIQLIRAHEYTETVKTAINVVYPFEHAAKLYLEKFDTSEENIKNILEITSAEQKQAELEEEQKQQDQKPDNKGKTQEEIDDEEFEKNTKKPKSNKSQALQNQQNNQQNQKGKKQKNTKNNNNQKNKKQEKEKKLKDVVFKIVPSLHLPVIEHIISTLGFDMNQKCSEEQIPIIKQCAEECIKTTQQFIGKRAPGYLIISEKTYEQEQTKKQEEEQKTDDKQLENTQQEKKNIEMYFDFTPIVLVSQNQKKFKQFDSYNDAIDLYFQKLSQRDKEIAQQNNSGAGNAQTKQSIILKKFNNIIKDQDNRIQNLKTEQEIATRKAQLIEMNIEIVEAIANIVKQMKQGGIAWDKIYKMINEGKENGDPLANLINDMDFDKNRITVLLEDPLEDQESEMTEVEIDIYENAYSNARAYYQNKKANAKKEIKTQEAKDIALKQAELTAQREIEKNQVKTNAVDSRKTYWFEKFYWFISSENYLVLSGRDAAQNEVLMKKYMRKGDIYMHADYHGSASTIIKNSNPSEPIPQQTLDEAAQASACRSKAWDSKILPSVYWVYDHQVSKKAETGEYLPHGSFMIRGKKNFINPMRMEMGAVLLFKIDEQFIKNHLEDRMIKGKEEESNKDDITDIQDNDLPSYDTLKQQSSMYSQQTQEQEDNQVTMIDMLNKKNTIGKKPSQQQQKGQKQQQQKEGEKGAQPLKKGQKSNIELKKMTKKQLAVYYAQQEKMEKEQELEEQTQEHTVNVPRGKANKIRKMKKKYGDQTEEEREFKMKILGTKNVQGFDWKVQQQEKDQDFKNLKDDDEQKQEQQENDEKKEQQEEEQKNNDKKESEKTEKQEENQEKDNEDINDDEKSDKAQEEQDEKNEKALIEEQKNLKYDEEEGQINQEIKELTKLTTYVNTDETFKNYLFMCAPYNTLQLLKCKYRVKLTTGTQKKGKAGREILLFFQNQKEATPFEKQLMKCIPEQEYINQMIGNCKINAAGLLKMKMNKKQDKKQQRKQQDKAEEQIKQQSLLY